MFNNKLLKLAMMFLFGALASKTLTYMIAWSVLKESHHASDFALVSAVPSVFMIFSMPLIGIIVDKYAHKKLLVFAQVFSIFSLVLFFLSPDKTLISYIVIAVCLDIADLLFSITMYASVKSLAENSAEISKINSIEQGISAGFAVVSPTLAGFFLSFISARNFVWVEIVCEGIVIFIITRLDFRESGEEESRQVAVTEKPSYKAVVRFLMEKNILLIIIGIMVLLNFCLAAINVGVPFFLNKDFQSNTKIIGIVSTFFPLGLILGSISSSKIKLSIFYQLRISYYTCGAIILFFGLGQLLFSGNEWLILGLLSLLMFILGAALGISRIPMMTFAQINIPENIQGRAFSIMDTAAQVLAPLGLMFYGMLFDHFSSINIFILSGLFILLVVLTGFIFVDRADKSQYLFELNEHE